MRPIDVLLAVLTAMIWGLAFVATEFGLRDFTPAQLTALRFLIACLPALLLPRPAIAWPMLVLIGLTLFTGQFLLLFFAYTQDMPAGLASVVQQTQAFFTVILAALFLRELPRPRQWAGMAVAFAGLLLIGLTLGGGLTLLGLALTLAAALSWAVGNTLVKPLGGQPMLPLMAWLALVPPLPALALSALMDSGPSLPAAMARASWSGLGAALYLGAVATTLAYMLWGRLLARYPAATVAPIALIAPLTGVIAAALTFGESFGPLRAAGMALIVLGLAVIVLPAGRARAG